VIWVSGPPGCGKTTLVSSYIEARKLPCLWYQIDEGDTDPATFFYYLGLAAKRAAPRKRKPLPLLTPEYLQGISTFTLRYFEELYDRLNPSIPPLKKGGIGGDLTKGGTRKDLAKGGTRKGLRVHSPLEKGGTGGLIIVLDNYHEVPANSSFHEIISNGLSRVPEGINVIMISRSEPPPALIRLRANHLMEVLGWDELRLTSDESKGIARLRAKQKLSKEAIQHLHTTADGWAAGLEQRIKILPQSYSVTAPPKEEQRESLSIRIVFRRR
jgi:ATP/maltotriose-dependent transcriptional regulator MalT